MIETWFSPEQWISELVVQRVGWTLVHSLWQLSLLALAARWAADLWGRRSAAARHGMLLAGIMLMALAPVATWLASNVGDSRQSMRAAGDEVVLSGELATTKEHATQPVARTSTGVGQPSDGLGRPGQLFASDTGIGNSWSTTWQASKLAAQRFLGPKLRWIVLTWCVGVLLFAVRPLVGWWTILRLRTCDLAPAPPSVRAAFERASHRLGIRVGVELFESVRVRVPIVVGWLRPMILTPTGIVLNLTPSQLEAIMAHELAHIQRHDFLVNMLQTMIETLFFYHPAVWWVSQQIRLEREHCCDDRAATSHGDRVAYGRALLLLDDQRTGDSVLALGAGGGTLLRRVERLFDAPSAASPRATCCSWAGLLVAPLALVFITWTLQDNSSAREPAAAPLMIARAPQDKERETQPAPPKNPPAGEEARSKELKVQVREAILKGAEYLRSKQEEDGAWRLSNPSEMLDPGLTALSLVAMLRAGEPVDSQTAQRAFAMLAKAQPNSSYSISLRLIATCHLQAFDRQAVERDVAWLVAAQMRNGPSRGGWTYTSAPNRSDGSCTRFALWALDTARVCGVSVPEETWRLAAEFWLSSQSPQGGWSYIPGQGNATPSMTLAGIAGLESVRGAVADAALHLRIDAAVAKAWKFLEPLAPAADQWLSPQANSPMYRLHALSIAGRMSQQEKIAQLDWQTQGIELLLSKQKPGTGEWESSGGESAIVSTAFALLFLRPTESSHRKPSP